MRTGNIENNELQILNSRVENKVSDHTLTLTTRVDAAEEINERNLDRLSGKTRIYEALISGDFNSSIRPVDQSLHLKELTQVMFIKNHEDDVWVNGTLSLVGVLNPNYIEVELPEGNICEVTRELWGNIKYKFNPNTKKS